jgi:TPR repeat protein
MHRRFVLAALVLAEIGAAALPARAQFYDLDGKYRCLAAPDQSCAGAVSLPPPAPAGPAAAPAPTIDEVLADIRAQKLSSADLHLLETQAAKKDPRAIEALAWCRLNGLGVPPDLLAAYFLYGEAAGLNVPNAKANQRAIFERKLTQEQRQTVLMREQTR